MKVLLAGAGGQLGHDLVAALVDVQVHAFTHEQLDIGDPDAVTRATEQVRPDWIINAAAFNDVDGAEQAPERAFRVNADGPRHLALAAAAAGAALLHVSTDYVFDGRKGSPYVESDRPNPLSVYARSKLQGEEQVRESGADWLIVRTAWLYGRQGNNFVKAIQGAARSGGPLRVVADQVGSPTATRDLAEAIAGLIQQRSRGIFHAVNAGACSRFDFARAIVGQDVRVEPMTTAEAGRRAPRPAYSALASERWTETGLRPLPPWELALKAFLAENDPLAD